ncbi:VirB4 family type IV secretion system protein [Brevibacillus sp. NPDC003359]|uniref:VirB4 family type IV secretion system protein n=1 Tax=unclassified Brevibacillus TaxID=2684853 RepID=UPI0036CEEED8
MFGFNRKKQAIAVTENDLEQGIGLDMTEDVPLYMEDGKGDLWDILCPDGLNTGLPNHGLLADSLAGERPFRSMYITKGGYPREFQTDWISHFMGVGEVDVTIHSQKIPPRQAMVSLKKQLTVLQSNKDMQLRMGQINQIHDINTKLSDTDALIGDIQLGQNDLFHTSIQATAYGDNEDMLDRLSEFLEDDLGGKGIHLRSAYERQNEGYLSVLPRGKNELLDTYRNLDRRSLSTLFPFASSELKFRGGVPFAVNQSTGNLTFLNLFDESFMNYNAALLGESGSGKTVAIDTLVGRNLLIPGLRAVIIDPEGEQKKFTKRLSGLYIKLGSDSPIVLNPCALTVTEIELDEDDDEELIHVEDGRELITKDDGRIYIRFVPLKEKIQEIVTFFNILSMGFEETPLNNTEERYLLECIQECFKDAGITNEPKSLYKYEPIMRDGKIVHDQILKDEITITDIFNMLVEKFGQDPKGRADRLIDAIHPWLRGGTRGFFDGQTYYGPGVSTDLNSYRIITFDLSEFEVGSSLRKLSYHVCQIWTWHHFVKNPMLAEVPKIVVNDEYWQIIDQNETVAFSETMGRRCRKRHTSYIIASQDAKRVLENSKAYGVITNCSIVFILRQNSISYELMKEAFNLSNGELSIVMGRPKKGEMIMRTPNESAWIQTDLFEYERVLFESNSKKKKELERQMKAYQDSLQIQKISPEVESLKDRILQDEGEFEFDESAELDDYEVDEHFVAYLRGQDTNDTGNNDSPNYIPEESRSYLDETHKKLLEVVTTLSTNDFESDLSANAQSDTSTE